MIPCVRQHRMEFVVQRMDQVSGILIHLILPFVIMELLSMSLPVFHKTHSIHLCGAGNVVDQLPMEVPMTCVQQMLKVLPVGLLPQHDQPI